MEKRDNRRYSGEMPRECSPGATVQKRALLWKTGDTPKSTIHSEALLVNNMPKS